MERPYDLVQIWGPWYFWTGHVSVPVCAVSGNYVWRKAWWRIYRCWYEEGGHDVDQGPSR